MTKHIKVEWIEHKYVIPPEEYTSYPTQEQYDVYTKSLKEATVKHQGEIIDFVNTFFVGTKAIIEGTDRKLYRINIDNLKVIEKFKEATNNKYSEIYRVFEFYINKGYTIYSEIGAYLMDYLISGTIDIFCYRPTDFVILDWKTNRDGLKFEAGYYKKDKSTIPNQLTDEWVHQHNKKMLPPVAHLADCNGMHYSLQLSMYAIMAEMILGIPCHGLGLCHIGSPWILNKYGQPYRDSEGYHVDENGEETVKWYKIDYLRNEVISLLKDRSYKLAANKKQVNKQLNLFQ